MLSKNIGFPDHTGNKKLRKDEKSKCLAHGKFYERYSRFSHLASVCRRRKTAHYEVNEEVHAMMSSILMVDKTRQNNLAKKHFLNSAATSQKKGR